MVADAQHLWLGARCASVRGAVARLHEACLDGLEYANRLPASFPSCAPMPWVREESPSRTATSALVQSLALRVRRWQPAHGRRLTSTRVREDHAELERAQSRIGTGPRGPSPS